MRQRLGEEDGFTLLELITAITIAMVVSLAAFALVEFTMKRAGEVEQRVDATQRGRMIMDTITRQLRSQVCLDATTPSMATRAGDITDDFTATFYADFTDGTDASKPTADLHKLRYDSVTRRITDTTYKSSWNKTTTPWTPVVPAAASSVRVVASDVVPYNSLPLFTYYAYDNAAIPSPTIKLWPAGAGGLSLADLGRVARIDISFKALPTNRGANPNAPGAVAVQDQIYVRAADPNDDAPTPTCA